MPDSPVISGVADLPKFYFAEGAPFRLSLTIGAEFSMTGKFVTFGMRARSGTVRRVFGTDSGEANLTIAGQVITFNVATTDATVPAFASGWTLEDVQAKGETEYWVDISASEGSDVLLRLQGQADWVAPGSDIAESSAVVSSPAIDVDITSGAVSVSVAVLGAAEPTLTTNTATSGLTGILKAASNTLDVAVAGTDYVATNDSRLTDARTPTSHVHGGISNAGAIGSTSGLPIKTGTSGVLEAGAFGTGSGQFAQGNDARFHDRSHAMTSTSDHTAGNWKVFHSNGSGQLVELALGADGTYLKSNGASAAPTFATPSGGGSSITGTGIAYVRSGGNDTTGTIGNPSLPYLTAQAAWDDGARVFDFGVGAFTITHTSDVASVAEEAVFVRGVGKEDTALTLNWNGIDGIDGFLFESPPPPFIDPTSGTEASKLVLSSDKSLTISLSMTGGEGGRGVPGTPGTPESVGGQGGQGANGGDRAELNAFNCCFTSISYAVGPAGLGGIAGSDGGAGAGTEGTPGTTGLTGGSSIFKWCDLPSGFTVPTDSTNVLASLRGTDLVTNDLWFDYLSNSNPGGFSLMSKIGTIEGNIVTLQNRAVTEHYMRTIDFTDSSGTVSDVTGLSCSVAENEKILIEIVGFRVGGAAGSGLKISFSGPGSPTDVRYTLEHWNAVSTGRTVAAATAFNTTLTQADGNTDTLPIRVTLTLINGTDPNTVQFRAASESSGTTITLLKGMTMRVHRIP